MISREVTCADQRTTARAAIPLGSWYVVLEAQGLTPELARSRLERLVASFRINRVPGTFELPWSQVLVSSSPPIAVELPWPASTTDSAGRHTVFVQGDLYGLNATTTAFRGSASSALAAFRRDLDDSMSLGGSRCRTKRATVVGQPCVRYDCRAPEVDEQSSFLGCAIAQGPEGGVLVELGWSAQAMIGPMPELLAMRDRLFSSLAVGEPAAAAPAPAQGQVTGTGTSPCLGVWTGVFDEGEQATFELTSRSTAGCGRSRYVFRVREMECSAEFAECSFIEEAVTLREGPVSARCSDGLASLACACHPSVIELSCRGDLATAMIQVPLSGYQETFRLRRRAESSPR